MDDLIIRAKIQKKLQWVIDHGLPASDGKHNLSAECMLEYVKNMPSAQRKGKWVERNTHFMGEKCGIEEWQSARCSVCEKYHTTPYLYFFEEYNFCPNCGADMREGSKDDR